MARGRGVARGRQPGLTHHSAIVALSLLTGCGHAGLLGAPPGHGPACPGAATLPSALQCHAPILMQETAAGMAGVWDRPTPLDPDGSGALRDDAVQAALAPASGELLTVYARAAADATRLYLFYGLYYPADWSGRADAPELDHPGDFEGALVVVEVASGTVEAVVTQAHNLFYLWLPEPRADLPAAAAGTVTIAGGRPVLFAESGGHGLYAFGYGAWAPAGGTTYENGPAALPPERLRRFELVDVRPLDELEAFADGPLESFRDLPGGAKPPWRWVDRRRAMAGPGAIVLAPDGFYRAIRRLTRP